MKILILARGGSKRLPNKQLRLLGNKPMMDYACLEAKKIFSEVWFSCDDKEINNHAKELGLKVIERPLLFTDDHTPAIQGIRYCLQDQSLKGDIMLLNPCCPLLTAQDISNAMDLYTLNKFDSLVSVTSSQEAHPSKVCQLEGGDVVAPKFQEDWQTQHGEGVKIYRRNAALYIFKEQDIWTNSTIFNGRIGVYEMPPEKSIDINTPFDFLIAELYMKHLCK